MDREKLLKIATKAQTLENTGKLGLAKEFVSIDDKITEVGTKLSDLSEELKKKEYITTEVVKELRGQDGDNGEDYILTEQDKEEIASFIKVPVVEKVIERVVEKTEVIRETPIVTNEVKEIAVADTAIETRNKLETLQGEERLDASAVKNLPEFIQKSPIPNGGGWRNLFQLHDVSIPSPSVGDLLQWNGTKWINTPFDDNGILSLNGLTSATQTFATGTSGTDFNISSATSIHTFNLPTASATNRGALSSTDWSTFNNKLSVAVQSLNGLTGAVTLAAGTNITLTPVGNTITIAAIGDGTGTVTSVDMTVPTGLSISGNPITTSGTLALSLASGYVIPLQSTLDGYVPYTGATSNLNLGTFDLLTDTVKASTSAGLSIQSNNGTVTALFGAGGGANSTFYGGSKFDYATASTVPYLDSSKNLISSAVTPTELGYVSGVTSSIQTQLNGKQASLGYTPEDVANKSTNTSLGTSDTLYPTQNAVKTYADGLVAGLLDYRGGYDASGNVFPSSGGSGTAGAVLKGDMWVISVAGTLGGNAVAVGDSIAANVDTPGQTSANWNTFNSNLTYVPEDVANKVTTISGASTNTQYPSAKLLYDQLALKVNLDQTSGQTIGSTGARLTKLWATDITVTNAISGSITGNASTVTTNANLTGIVTSVGNATAIADAALSIAKTSGLQTALDAKAPLISPTFATSVTGSYLTASEMLITDASKNIVSAPVATYPSLTELTYLKGVTSSIQTQLNAKGSGTVTSVAALTLGTTGTDLSSSVATGTTTPVITLNVPTASASNRGALSSTDWSTFNGKQSAITFGTGVQTALGVNIGSAGAPVLFNGAGGTPTSLVGTNISGTAASLTAGAATVLATPRAIYGNNFDGSAALTQVIASTYGGTGNGFTKFSGPTTSEKTFTLPNSSATLLYSGGALGTPSSGTGTNITGIPAANILAGSLGTGNFTVTGQLNVTTVINANTSGTVTSGFATGMTMGSWDMFGYPATGSNMVIGGYRSSQWDAIRFYASASEKMRVTTTGLGIGETAPAAALHVNSGGTSLQSIFNSTNADGGYQRFDKSGTTYGYIGNQDALTSLGGTGLALRSTGSIQMCTNGGTVRVVVDTAGGVRFNNYGAGTLVTDSAGNITASSDERLKDIQGQYSAGLQEILKINPIIYKWNEESKLETKDRYAGFSAQNVREAIGGLSVGKTSDGHLTLQERAITAALVNAVKELQEQIKQLQEKVL